MQEASRLGLRGVSGVKETIEDRMLNEHGSTVCSHDRRKDNVEMQRVARTTLLRPNSDLAFDVHFLVSGLLGRFEKTQSFACPEPDTFVSFYKECLATVFAYESGTLVIGFEAKFLGNKSQLNIGLVPAQEFSIWPNKTKKHRRTICKYSIAQRDVRGLRTYP